MTVKITAQQSAFEITGFNFCFAYRRKTRRLMFCQDYEMYLNRTPISTMLEIKGVLLQSIEKYFFG